jgi:hypothetical protein
VRTCIERSTAAITRAGVAGAGTVRAAAEKLLTSSTWAWRRARSSSRSLMKSVRRPRAPMKRNGSGAENPLAYSMSGSVSDAE